MEPIIPQTKAIPELSIDTQTIERILLITPIGVIIPYYTLTAAIGRDVQHDARHILRSACRRVLREPHRMLFEAVANVGVKRLDDIGKIAAGRMHITRGHNQATYAYQKTRTVDDFDQLPNHLKIEHNVVLAQAGTLRHMTSARTTAKLAAHIGEPKKDMPLRSCLKAMEPLV